MNKHVQSNRNEGITRCIRFIQIVRMYSALRETRLPARRERVEHSLGDSRIRKSSSVPFDKRSQCASVTSQRRSSTTQPQPKSSTKHSVSANGSGGSARTRLARGFPRAQRPKGEKPESSNLKAEARAANNLPQPATDTHQKSRKKGMPPQKSNEVVAGCPKRNDW